MSNDMEREERREQRTQLIAQKETASEGARRRDRKWPFMKWKKSCLCTIFPRGNQHYKIVVAVLEDQF